MDTIALYNLSVEMRGILADLHDSGGELTPEVEARLQALEGDTSARVAQMALACRELDRSATAIEQEKGRLATRAVPVRNAIQTIRDCITDHMAQTGTPKVKTDLVTVSLVEGPEKVVWDGKEENIPEAYRKTLVEYLVDRELALRHHAEGVPLPEGMRIRRSQHIRIV